MALQDIAQVSISLQTSGVSRAAFGTPIFLTAHNYFSDLTRSYTKTADVTADTEAGSNAATAALAVFNNNPSVDTFKVGRIIASSIITPNIFGGSIPTGSIFSITVTDGGGNSVLASYTSLIADTPSIVVTELVADINAILGTGGTAVVLVTNNGDTFTIARAGAFSAGGDDGDFTVSLLANNVVTAAADLDNTNTAANASVLNAYSLIQEADNDFYVVTWEGSNLGGLTTGFSDDTATLLSGIGVLDVATTIEGAGSDDSKLFFVGASDDNGISNTYSVGDTPTGILDIAAWMAFGNFSRTVTWWHNTATTTFNQLTFAGFNLPFDAGSITWANLRVNVSAAQNSDGKALTQTQQQNLSDKFANWATIQGGIVYTREGKVAGNEFIDIIRGRDNLKSDLEADLFNILTNQQGTKIPYTDKGINLVKGVVDRRLNDYKVNRNFLSDFTITVPKASDIPQATKITRILEDMSFTATLQGAIQLVDLTGTLTV